MAKKDNSDNEILHAAEKVWGVLDKLAESNPEEYKKFIDQQMKEGAQSVSQPEPAFCLSCIATLRRHRYKLFINVCKWSQVPQPKSDTDPIPVKGGTLRHLVKNDSKTSQLVFEIAFSPHVVEECCKQSDLELSLIDLSLNFVSDFAKLEIDKDSCKKLKTAFKGARDDLGHSLDDRLKHLLHKESRLDIGDSILEELRRRDLAGAENEKSTWNGDTLPSLKLPSTAIPGRKLIEELPSDGCRNNGGTLLKRPEYSIVLEREKTMVIVKLPGVTSVQEVELDVSEEDVCLEVATKYRLVVRFPSLIDEDSVTAKFNPAATELLVTASLQQS